MEGGSFSWLLAGTIVLFTGIGLQIEQFPVLGSAWRIFSVMDHFPVTSSYCPAINRTPPRPVEAAVGERGVILEKLPEAQAILLSWWFHVDSFGNSRDPVDDVDGGIDPAGGNTAGPGNNPGNENAPFPDITLVPPQRERLVEVGQFQVVRVGVSGPVDLRAVVGREQDECRLSYGFAFQGINDPADRVVNVVNCREKQTAFGISL